MPSLSKTKSYIRPVYVTKHIDCNTLFIVILFSLAFCHTCYPILAMVPYKIWQENSSVYWNNSKYWQWLANLWVLTVVELCSWTTAASSSLTFCNWQLVFSLQSVVPFMIMVVLVPSNLIVTYVVSFAAGVSVAAAFLLPWWVPDNLYKPTYVCVCVLPNLSRMQ